MLNFVNFRYRNFFVSANNKRKVEEQTTEEFYTSSFEEIPGNGSIAVAIIQQYKKRRIKMSNYRNEKYSYEFMKFSLTLQGYSRKAYNYVRESFDVALPSESSLSNLLNDCSPEFSSSCFRLIESKIKELKNKSELFLFL